MRLIASFAKVEPSEPYDFNVSLVLKQDGYNVKVDSKYTPWVKLGLAALTAAGLLGGAHQAGVVDVFPEEVLLYQLVSLSITSSPY
jgi:hypothetical protein